MKNIFTKTLTLIAFLSLSIGVWGGQYDLNFLFTKTGASTKEDVQAYTNCSSYEDKDKAIMDSDWEWNTGKDDLENKGSFVSLKNGPKACSHIEYDFPAGNVTVKLYAHFTSNDGIASFPVKIGAYTCNFDALSQDGPHSSNDYTYEGTINVESAGTYRITVDFPNTDKMQVSHMTFDYAGGPTCTNTLTIEAEDTELMVAPDGKTLPNYYVNKDERGNTSENIPTLISQASAGQFIAMMLNETNKYLYYKFSTSQAASFTIKIKASNMYNGKNGDVILYSTKSSNSESITVEGTTYKKVTNFQAYANSGNQQWCETNQQNISEQPADDFILAVSSTDYWTMYYDKFTIEASANVFCTEVPATGYSITYYCNGGTTCPENEDNQTALPDPLPTITKAGYNFGGWYSDEQFEHPVTAGAELEDDIDLYAKWTEDLSTVWYMKGTFKDNWETQYDFVKATGHSTDQEASVTVQNLDANTNYWFQIWDNTSNHGAKDDNMIMYHNNTGWYLDGTKNVGVHTTAAGDYTFTVNFAGNDPSLTVYYPEFVTVTVNLMGHGGNYELYTSPNGTISKPADPTADDYKFWGWYANSECTTPFDFAAPIATNTTAYAKWTLWETSNYTMHTQNTQDGNKAWFIRTVAGSQSYYIFDFAIPETSYSEQFFVGQGGYWYSQDMGYNKCSKSANWYYGWLPFTNLQGKGSNITLGSAVGAIGTLKIADNSCDPNLYISFDPQGYGLLYGTPNQDGWVDMAFTQENSGTVWNTTQVTLTSDMLGKSFYVGLAKQGGGYVFSSRSDNDMVGFSNTVAFTTMGVLTKADTWRSGNLTSADAGQVGHFQIWTDNTAQNGCCHFVLHYNATFVYNNGQENTSTEYKSCLADNNITFPTPEAKTGYTFEGWYDNSSFTCTKYDAGSEFNLTNTGSKTFYAKWTPKTSHITFNANGGKIDSQDTKVLDYIYDGESLTLPTPDDREGYDFNGWFTETTGGTQIDNVGGSNKPVANVEYFAQWTVHQHILTWAGTEGATILSAGVPASGQVAYGTALTAPVLEKAGYTYTWSPEVPATMPDNDVTYTATWTEKPKVDALIVTGAVNNVEHNNGSASFTYTHSDDAFFGHKVLKIEYSNMSGNYGNSIISIDNGYQSSSSTGATGFGFWYKTDAGVTSIAFCFDYNNGSDQKKTQLPGTNGAWKYVYVASSRANGWSGSNIIIWMNGTDNNAATGNWTPSTLPHSGETTNTNPSSGTLYISEIRATEITEKFINYTVNFTQPLQGSTSARIKDGAAISSGDEVPEGTQVIFTWNEVSGYDFVNFSDGTNTYTQNPCTLTVNSNLTVTTTVEVEATKHTLTVNAGEHGSVSPDGETQVGENREVIITATPESHYGFASWTATGITLTDEQQKQNPLTITMPTNDVTLTASFEHVYVDNMIATGNNSSTPTYNGDATMSAESVVDANGFFSHNVLQFTYSGMNSSGDYKGVVITRDADYQQSSSVGATGFGFYYKTAAGQTITFCFDYGDGNNQKKTELPSTNGFWKYAYVKGSAANGWNNPNVIIYVNGSGGAADGVWTPSSLNVSSANTTPNSGTFFIAEICATERTTKPEQTPVYTATFAANPSNMATVTATVDDAAITSGGAVDAGKSITFDYSNVDANYRFTGWTATGISLTDVQKQEHPLTLTMPSASITLTANFVRVYTLVVNKDANIASVTGAGQYAENEEVTVTATAAQGYKFTKWTEGAGGTQLATTSSYTFNMPATDNYTVYANSEQDITYYRITLGECTNGTIAATVNGEPYEGTNLTANTPVVLKATPADGYGFVQWKDGSRDNPHTIFANSETQARNPWTATFDQIYTVTTEFGKPGSEVTGGGTYPIGGLVTLEAFVSDKEYELDYNFSHWEQVSGTAPITGHENDNPLTFTMPAQDLELKAIYAPVECVDTFVIQCEDDNAYIPYNKQDEDLTTYPSSIPNDGQCGPYHDYYNGYHGTGYYDYKGAKSAEMYYPIELPASTYKFEIWSASNGDKNCWMNLYIESDDPNPEVVYKEVNYKKTSFVTANNNCGKLGYFAISGTIDNVVLSSSKSVIIGLYCGEDYGAFDQIRITATGESKPFCHELSTETFTINSGETKEIPVCGVNNLIIYDGGQANNEENVEVKTSIKHIRQVKQLDVWEDFALPFTATSIQVEDPDDHNMYDIYPAIKQYDGNKEEWIVKPGFFYMQELQHEEKATVIGTEFRQRWEHSQNLFPQENTPYIIEFIQEQSGGYFLNTFITYGKTGSTEVVGYDNAIVNNGSWPQDGTKPTFHYVANNAVVPVVPYDAYVLSDDHTMFELKEQPKILPFHCYIQASAETKAIAKVLRLVGGGGTPTTLVPIYIDAEHQNYKVMIDEVIYIVRDGKIYTVMGQLVK